MSVMSGNVFLVWLFSIGLLLYAEATHKPKHSNPHGNSHGSSEWEWNFGTTTFFDIDLTILENSAGRDVVEATLDTIGLACIFPDDKLLLRRIAAALTNDGLNEETFIGGAEGGIWNITDAILETTKLSSQLEVYRRSIYGQLDIDWTNVTLSDMLKPLYSALAMQLYVQTVTATTAIPRTAADQASFITNQISGIAGVGEAEIVQEFETLTDNSCSSTAMDVVLVLDGSGSVTSDNFAKVRSFVRKFIDSVDLDSSYTRVAVVQYSADVRVEFDMDTYFSKADAKDAVNEIEYMQGSTNTAKALLVTAGHMFSVSRGARETILGVPRVAIVVTDGKSNDERETAEAARYLRETGVVVFAVGIGSGVDLAELNAIASNPDCTHVYQLIGFDEIESFVEEIKQAACREPGQLEVGGTIRAVLEAGQSIYTSFMVNVNEGFKFDFSTRKGEIRAYLSTKTKNPNGASHMWRCRGNMVERGLCLIPPGQLKKLVRNAEREIRLYLSLNADEEEGAYFALTTAAKSFRLSASYMVTVLSTALLTLRAFF